MGLPWAMTSSPRLIVRKCYDFSLAVPADDGMFGDIVTSAQYEPYVMAPILEASRGKRVLDVGANIGIFTIGCAKVATSVIAIEASVSNAKILFCNIALNNISNVTVYPVAASDQQGLATFRSEVASNKVLHPLAITPENIDDVEIIYATTLDHLLGDTPIDVIKIDIEGREYAALQGANKLLHQRPVMFLEYSPNFMMHGCGVEPGAFFQPLFEVGYQVTILHRDMSLEDCGQDIGHINNVWNNYIERGISHLDLRLT